MAKNKHYVNFQAGDYGLTGDHAVLPVGLLQELDLEFVMELVDVVLEATLKLKTARISHVPVCLYVINFLTINALVPCKPSPAIQV